MARAAIQAAFILTSLFGASVVRADDSLPEVPDEVAASWVGVNPDDLRAARAASNVNAITYLYAVGHLIRPGEESPPVAVASPAERLAECLIWHESRGNPNAVNRSSGASGLGQFLRSTWTTTPQGKAGYSVFDPAANRQAVVWMIQVGRQREFATLSLCR